MKLADHLREVDKQARRELAARAGTSVGYLYLVAGGHRRASAELSKRIEQATDGKVTRHDLRPDIFDAPEGTAEADAEPEARAA